MESSPGPDRPLDPSKPFEGLVLCCTNIEADLRTEIAQRTADLGGIHKYDLTPDVTHLIVGDYDTAKYRHVARERPDIKPMAAGWVDAVRELWLEDTEFDFAALENTWRLKTFETGGGIPKSPVEEQRERTRLICCLTGFEDNETRTMIEGKVKANGGNYVGDLSRRVTHLIVNKPEGKKYVAARKWGIRTVSIEWLYDSIQRGMILNEECYDPTLPTEERGKGAWIRNSKRGASLGKRLRDGTTAPSVDDGRRKLRKTASMKLTSQRDDLWGDILVKQPSTDLSGTTTGAAPDERIASVPPVCPAANPVTPVVETPSLAQPSNQVQQVDGHIFSSCRFFVHGFIPKRQEILHQHITSHDGQISMSIEDVASSNHKEPLDRRYLIVPQTSQPDSHPKLPEGMHIVTEFYIERCIHNKIRFKPNDHVLGQPFPQFPIDGFHELTICTAGFKNEQLNQVEKAVTQLGAKYSERLNAQCTLLICPSLDEVRKPKLDFAIFSKIPVVGADWLWNCITTGCLMPWNKFLFQELPQKSAIKREAPKSNERDETARSKSKSAPGTELKSKAPSPTMKHGIDVTAFDDDMLGVKDTTVQEQETDRTNYGTAPTHQAESSATEPATVSAPLSEMTSNALNKSPSPQKSVPTPRKLKRFPTGGEVGDSEGGDESDTSVNRPENEDNTSKNKEQERKRQAQRAKAAEREEMSKRLKSLVAPDNVAQEGDSMKPQPVPRQQRRRREILGRAASNVSTASSASAESSAHMSSFKSNSRKTESIALRLDSVQTTAGAFGILDKMMMEHNNGNNQATQDGDSPPRATQLEYDNPEAREHRAVVMDRMMADRKQVDLSGKKQSQAKDSLTSLKDDVRLGNNTQRSSASSRRRSTRRR
ncbi:BRCT domain-containing protein [Hypoxylon sp. FL0890]|nr:BRCT domain-containing protein [Hypoxylon sp. FL0890]